MNVLLPNEQTLFTSPGGSLLLTSHRVRYEAQGGGSNTLISIMLEQVASCGTVRIHHTILLVIAAISLILGTIVSSMLEGGSRPFFIGALIAVVFVGLYFASRQHILVVASAGSTIRANMTGTEPEVVTDFIDQLESAKNTRYFSGQQAG